MANTDGKVRALNPFERSARTLQFAIREFFATPAPVLATAWLQGAAVTIAAPAVLVDPRIRGMNEGSFYNSSGSSFLARVNDFITGNDPAYVSWFVFGSIFSIHALLLQGFGWIVLPRRAPRGARFFS